MTTVISVTALCLILSFGPSRRLVFYVICTVGLSIIHHCSSRTNLYVIFWNVLYYDICLSQSCHYSCIKMSCFSIYCPIFFFFFLLILHLHTTWHFLLLISIWMSKVLWSVLVNMVILWWCRKLYHGYLPSCHPFLGSLLQSMTVLLHFHVTLLSSKHFSLICINECLDVDCSGIILLNSLCMLIAWLNTSHWLAKNKELWHWYWHFAKNCIRYVTCYGCFLTTSHW